jgi:hypothetical protein
MKKKIQTIHEFLGQVEKRYPQTFSQPQNIITIFDFYDNWKHFKSGIKSNSLSILVEPEYFKKNSFQNNREYLWKSLSVLVMAVGAVLFFINLMAGLLLLIPGGTSYYLVDQMKKTSSERLIEELAERVINGKNFEVLIDLTISYISGIIAFSSPHGSSKWPQYPSCVFTGQKRIIKKDTPLPFFRSTV